MPNPKQLLSKVPPVNNKVDVLVDEQDTNDRQGYKYYN